jgi:GH18 family chitinase
VDLDWENPANDTELQDYATLVAAIRKGFEAHQLQLTLALAGWQGLPAKAIKAIDRVHLMAYDAMGRHATFAFAKADVARVMKSGTLPAKICLGLPFYGRSIKDAAKSFTYAELLRKYQPAADVDEVDGIYFNGSKTIERKTQYALETKLAGVMAWELGQDTQDDRSLLRAIHRVVPVPQR